RSLGFYMSSEEFRKPLTNTWQKFLFTQTLFMIASMGYGAIESIDDIVILGRDITFLLAVRTVFRTSSIYNLPLKLAFQGIYLYFRMVFLALYTDQIEEILEDLEHCFRFERKGPGQQEVRSTRRWHFMLTFAAVAAWVTSLITFALIQISTPFWVASQTLPLHAALPFQMHNSSKHPIIYGILYLSQSFCLLYLMGWLVFAEFLCATIHSELTTSLHVLCIELRNLKEFCNGNERLMSQEVGRMVNYHQSIIRICERVNKLFNAQFIFQMSVNYLQISLAVFEALTCRHNPKEVIEYSLLMFMALGHLSFWSKYGDMLEQESLQVTVAAYEAYDPECGSKTINMGIGFMIFRAQKALQMRADPCPPFNLVNYMALLKQCFSILTLLLQTLD
ncbi:hypothetical protein KR018_007157, partial [Drosophila ironensis]